jgi:intracellular multiplication protein IcmC
MSVWTSTTSILNNLVPSLQSIQYLLTGAAYIIGITFLIRGVMALKQLGEHRSQMSPHHTIKEPVVFFLSGAMLLYLNTAINTFNMTVFGDTSILAYNQLNSSNFTSQLASAGQGIILFVQVIGLIAFIRGWIIIAKGATQSGHGQGGFGKGLMHIFGGIMAINIVATLNIITNTIYGG